MKLIKVLLAIAAVILLIGCSHAITSRQEAFAATKAPPSASQEYTWVQGAWRWDKKAQVFTWRDGYWATPGKKWVAPHWVETRKGMKYVDGQWR